MVVSATLVFYLFHLNCIGMATAKEEVTRKRGSRRHQSRRSLFLCSLWCSSTAMALLTAVIASKEHGVLAFSSLVMMGGRSTKKSNLKRLLDDTSQQNNMKPFNDGKQEILGVTLPLEGQIKGWEINKETKMKLACACVNGKYYAVQADCPRCAFDLYRGKVAEIKDQPYVECPTCSATFSLKSGARGPVSGNKQGGLAGFVNNLAKTATIANSSKDAKAYGITVDSEQRILWKEQ